MGKFIVILTITASQLETTDDFCTLEDDTTGNQGRDFVKCHMYYIGLGFSDLFHMQISQIPAP